MNALAALLALEARDEPWPIDAKDRFPQDEASRQQAFIRDAHIVCPGVDIVAIPNAGKRTRWEQQQRRREGMKAGALDLVCTWAPTHRRDRGTAFIEFKDGTSMPDGNQVDRLNLLYRWGHNVAVVRTAASAFQFLKGCGAPVHLRDAG